jgi:hypothetical protein
MAAGLPRAAGVSSGPLGEPRVFTAAGRLGTMEAVVAQVFPLGSKPAQQQVLSGCRGAPWLQASSGRHQHAVKQDNLEHPSYLFVFALD